MRPPVAARFGRAFCDMLVSAVRLGRPPGRMAAMALVVGTSTALRGTHDLRRLVEAIVAAGPHDEADWVEWKSALDLSGKEGSFQVARAVLGMANRLPERAGLTCEGLGYVVVGAHPGSIEGVASIDPASLDQLLEPYLGGAEGPRFTPIYLPVNNRTVFIVTVEAPRPGDRIFTLRKEWGKYSSGTVFVRKSGRTVIADAADMDALQHRLSAASLRTFDLQVAVVGDVPLSWFDGTTLRADVERWAAERADRLIAEAQATEQRRLAPQPPAPASAPEGSSLGKVLALQEEAQQRMAEVMGRLQPFQGQADTRTLDQYIAEVQAWQCRLSDLAVGVFSHRYVEAGHGVVELEVRNPTGRFLRDLELEVHFDFERLAGVDSMPEGGELPAPPRKYGEPPSPPSLGGFIDPRYLTPVAPFASGLGLAGRRTWVEKGSIRIQFGIGDLRQRARDVSDEVYLLLGARPEDGLLRGTWHATVPDVDGVLTGTIDVPVAEEPVDPIDVLESRGEAGSEASE